MRLIIQCMMDVASKNIVSHLLDMAKWDTAGEFEGYPVHKNDVYYIVSTDGHHIYNENLDAKIKDALEIDFDVMIFASRHRAASGKRSLTVHPLGNYHAAEIGGNPDTLVPASPHLMTQALRTLRANASSLDDYPVSFEVTHHGPYLETPTFFIEIGSSEGDWDYRGAGMAIAKTLLELGEVEYPIALGVGGGHYAPRMSDVAKEKRVSFGHMIPNYAIDGGLSDGIIEQAINKSGGPKIVYFHKKSMKKPVYRDLVERFASFGLESISSKMLEDL